MSAREGFAHVRGASPLDRGAAATTDTCRGTPPRAELSPCSPAWAAALGGPGPREAGGEPGPGRPAGRAPAAGGQGPRHHPARTPPPAGCLLPGGTRPRCPWTPAPVQVLPEKGQEEGGRRAAGPGSRRPRGGPSGLSRRKPAASGDSQWRTRRPPAQNLTRPKERQSARRPGGLTAQTSEDTEVTRQDPTVGLPNPPRPPWTASGDREADEPWETGPRRQLTGLQGPTAGRTGGPLLHTPPLRALGPTARTASHTPRSVPPRRRPLEGRV